jgi:site-specific recombinase XerD
MNHLASFADPSTERSSRDLVNAVVAALATSTEVSTALRAWEAAAREALARNTQRAYAADSKAFADWCQAQGRSTLPAEPETVAQFLRTQADAGKAVATVRRRAATISRMHHAAGLSNPCTHELVRLALKGIARAKGTDQRQAAGLTERDSLTIIDRTGNSVSNMRDIALMLVGRDLLARSSELVALTVADLEDTEGGMLVSVRRQKTSTESHACFIGETAAAALRAWIERAGIANGPVFQSLTKDGKATGRSLDTRDVRRILKGLAVAARLGHGKAVSGHSLRVGMAQDLVAANMDLASIMQAGGWATPLMVSRYTEKLTARRGAVARYYGSR